MHTLYLHQGKLEGYSGIIGLSPNTCNSGDKSTNSFVATLKNKGLIDNEYFRIYFLYENQKEIVFGGDIPNNNSLFENLTLSENKTRWKVNISEFYKEEINNLYKNSETNYSINTPALLDTGNQQLILTQDIFNHLNSTFNIIQDDTRYYVNWDENTKFPKIGFKFDKKMHEVEGENYVLPMNGRRCYLKIAIDTELILGEPFFVNKYIFFNVEKKYILIGTSDTLTDNGSFIEIIEITAPLDLTIFITVIIILFAYHYSWWSKLQDKIQSACQRIKERSLLREIANLKVGEEAEPGIAIKANSRPVQETV